jgi:hypothetical protein
MVGLLLLVSGVSASLTDTAGYVRMAKPYIKIMQTVERMRLQWVELSKLISVKSIPKQREHKTNHMCVISVVHYPLR